MAHESCATSRHSRAFRTRSYSFSSRPGRAEVSFLLRDTPTGALPTFLRGPAEVNHPIEFHGPFGTFYLREIKRRPFSRSAVYTSV